MSVVNYLLSERDNVEKARDAVAAILAAEFANQYALAVAASAADKEDYNIAVYLENTDPLSCQVDGELASPVVNVSLQGATTENASTATDSRKRKAEIYIDCYACGNYESAGAAGSRAAILSWKAARIARNIIEAANYAYLGLRGVVSRREIASLESGVPKTAVQASAVCVVRIVLNVWVEETSPQVSGAAIDPISLKIYDDSGHLIVEQ